TTTTAATTTTTTPPTSLGPDTTGTTFEDEGGDDMPADGFSLTDADAESTFGADDAGSSAAGPPPTLLFADNAT
ncbi:MAG: hypothetical protein M3431_04215, partial [Actinomycetota bacterium]|nr:hypothetical protein [Actinomycetota bacterium]